MMMMVVVIVLGCGKCGGCRFGCFPLWLFLLVVVVNSHGGNGCLCSQCR